MAGHTSIPNTQIKSAWQGKVQTPDDEIGAQQQGTGWADQHQQGKRASSLLPPPHDHKHLTSLGNHHTSSGTPNNALWRHCLEAAPSELLVKLVARQGHRRRVKGITVEGRHCCRESHNQGHSSTTRYKHRRVEHVEANSAQNITHGNKLGIVQLLRTKGHSITNCKRGTQIVTSLL